MIFVIDISHRTPHIVHTLYIFHSLVLCGVLIRDHDIEMLLECSFLVQRYGTKHACIQREFSLHYEANVFTSLAFANGTKI